MRRAAPGGSSAGCSRTSGPRSAPGVKSQEEVDALALYLFGDAPEGRQAIRELDATISEIPGLEGLHLLEGVLDEALARAPKPQRTRREPAVLAGV